jgi:hypothetical protein
MPTNSAQWDQEWDYDLHVLRGTRSRELLRDLLLHDSTSGRWRHATASPRPADLVGVRFVPQFQGTTRGDRVSGHGVEVDTPTGQVFALAGPLPDPALRTFWIHAVVTVLDPTNPSRTMELEPVPIRVQVRDAIAGTWLTPSTLTVRQGADGQRFTLLAQFDDGSFGDMTMVGSVDGELSIQWSSSSPDVNVSASGQLQVRAAPGRAEVTARLAPRLGGARATATIETVASWSAVLPAVAKLVAGGPGASSLRDVPNVLLLSDGFPTGEQSAFEALAQDLVRRLHTSGHTKPFNLLSGSMNYWTVFVPSRERGASVLAPFVMGNESNGVRPSMGAPVPLAPSAGSTPFNIFELTHAVGLPLQTDIPDGTDSGARLARSIRRWQRLYGRQRIPDARITPAVFAEWEQYWTWVLVDEQDTALGMAAGSRPRAKSSDFRSMNWNPRRTTRAHLDPFLANVRDEGGRSIGETWTTGKDRDLVFALSGGALGAGAKHEGLLAMGLSESLEHNLLDMSTRTHSEYAVDPLPLPRDGQGRLFVPARVHARGAHELAHAFLLHDEYGGSAVIPPGAVDGLATWGNVQPASQLSTAGTLRLHGDRLRWRWPRISHAGVLAAAPSRRSDGAFRIPLKRGHGQPFARGHTVYLRQRPLMQPLAPGAHGVNPAVLSPRLEVVDKAGDELIVRPLDPAAGLDPGDFPARPPHSSIILRPVAPPASATGAPYAELVAPIIRQHITTTGGPLNAPLNNPRRACTPDNSVVQIPTNLPPGLRRIRPTAWIVGAYDAGAGYHCGIYHPSGMCQMRSLEFHGVDQQRRPGVGVTNFCVVCRYLLIDWIDPTLHGKLDEGYARIYPQP